MKTCRAAQLLGQLAGSNEVAGQTWTPPTFSEVLGVGGGVVQLTIVTLGEEAACIVRAVGAGEAAHCGGVGLVSGGSL